MAAEYNRRFVITPSDTADIVRADQPMAFYVGGAGDAVLVDNNGTVVTLVGLQAGLIYPIKNIKRINATGTTATNLVGLRRT